MSRDGCTSLIVIQLHWSTNSPFYYHESYFFITPVSLPLCASFQMTSVHCHMAVWRTLCSLTYFSEHRIALFIQTSSHQNMEIHTAWVKQIMQCMDRTSFCMKCNEKYMKGTECAPAGLASPLIGDDLLFLFEKEYGILVAYWNIHSCSIPIWTNVWCETLSDEHTEDYLTMFPSALAERCRIFWLFCRLPMNDFDSCPHQPHPSRQQAAVCGKKKKKCSHCTLSAWWSVVEHFAVKCPDRFLRQISATLLSRNLIGTKDK